ncbi:hypothetical protein IJI31_07220 [bacterium]|nr:hypothetical protein [bacterium]
MGYNYSLGTGSYFNFIPASYGIMNAIHGTSADLAAIDLDKMVLTAYNTASYYNNLNNIQNLSMSLFSQLGNIAAGIPAASATAASPLISASSSTSSAEGKKTGDDVEKSEYDSKFGFIEKLIKEKKLSGYSKTLADIKKGEMTYAEAIKKLDDILRDIHANHRAELEDYANDLAKKKYTNTQNGSAMGTATEAFNEIDSWFRRDMKSGDLDDLSTKLSTLNESNIIDFIREFNSISGNDIISKIQERLPKDKQIKVDGERVQRRNGKTFGTFWRCQASEDRIATRVDQFENKIDRIIKSVTSVLITKAETYTEYMTAEQIEHLNTLKEMSSGKVLRKKLDLGSALMAVYNDIKDMDAQVANQQAKKEVEGYLPSGCTINVTGAKTTINRPTDPVGRTPSQQQTTFGVYA